LIDRSELCRRRIGRRPEDYLGPGYIGLCHAQAAYRPNRKTKFTSYAFVVIRHFMLLEAYNSGLVRVPVYVATEAQRRTQGLPMTRTAQERMSEETLEAAVLVYNSEYRPLLPSQEDQGHYGSDQGDNDTVDEADASAYFRRVLHKAVRQLDRRHRYVIRRHYGLGKRRPASLGKVADELGLTKSQVWELKDQAIKRLRGWLQDVLLR